MNLREHKETDRSLRCPEALKAIIILVPILTVAGIILWALQAPSAATGLLRVTFIDVGQGDAAWLKTPDGWDILIDGGKEAQGPDLVSYLQGQGVTDIEVLVLSHPHADHVGGLVTVLQNMEVDQALTNCQDYSSIIYQTFKNLLVDNSIPTSCVREGDTFTWGSYISATIVYPPDPLMSGTGSDVNNNSVTLRISYDAVDFLFAGDIESEAETAILASVPILEAEVLKVAHHGSNSSSTASFLSQVDPEVAIISVGASNPYGHPAPETLQRLGDAGVIIYRTDEDGTLVVTADGMTYSVQGEASHIYLPLVLKTWPTPTFTPTATPMPTSTPSPTPTSTPTPTPTATPIPSIQVSAWVSDPTPSQYTTVTVYGQFLVNGVGVAGVPMHTTWHYKTVTRSCDGVTDATGLAYCSRYISGATIGYTVVIDVDFTYGAQIYHTSTSFTPQ